MLNKAVINLELLKQNALSVKKQLKKDVKFNAVVKADAYGHGACKIASQLYKIADSFSVATVEEGVALRLSGIEKDILVLIPLLESDFARAVFYRLTITIDSIKGVIALEQACANQNRNAKVQIKFNSGMNRAGVSDLKELNAIIKTIIKSKWLVLDGMFSHFACPENKKTLICAQNKFLLAKNLVKGYNNKATCHISASGGFLSGVQEDMVRIGLLLYGYMPYESRLVNVKPIMKVYAPSLRARELRKNQSALYGVNPAKEDLSITLVRYGYADGLQRKQINAQFNNRCMDVSAVLGKRTGWVCVMDNADTLAKEYKTISYEILVKSAIKAEKIYVD